MYSFEGVTLDRKNGEYIVAVDGKKVDPGFPLYQNRNPLIATNRFISEISQKLHKKVKQYLLDSGCNPFMGCMVTMTCAECKKAGLNLKSANCFFDNAKEDVENERIYSEGNR